MSTLQGRSISESYKDLLQISNNNEGLDNQLRAVMDGEGDTSSLYVSTSSIQVSGTSIFNGNVGIGTDSPSEAFVVKGDDKRMFVASDDYNLFSIGRRSGSELDTAYLAMYDEGVKKVSVDTAGDTFFNGGNVGVGTSSPATKLHVVDDSTWDAFNIGSSNDTGAGFTMANSSRWSLLSTGVSAGAGGDKLGFHLSQAATGSGGVNGYKMVIDVDGNVGIGTTSPSLALHVYSDQDNDNAIFESSDTAVTLTLKDSTGEAKIESRNDFRFSNNAGADELLRIDSDGNVGIGTTSPGQSLAVGAKVGGDTNARTSLASFNASDNAFLEIENTSTQNPAGIILTNVTTKKWTIAKEGDDHNLFIKDASDSAVATFLQGGNVGIGNTDPQTTLHIGNSAAGSQWIRFSTEYGDFSIGNGSAGTPAEKYFSIYDQDANAHRLYISEDGNVGIGTSSPGEAFVVKGDDKRVFIASDDYNLFSVGRRSSGEVDTAYLAMYDEGVKKVSVDTAGDTFFNGGNVGIGTSSPSTDLHCENATSVSTLRLSTGTSTGYSQIKGGGTTGSFTIEADPTDSVAGSVISLGTDGTEKMRIDSDGDVGIGTATPDATLHVRANDDSENALALWVVNKAHNNSIISAYENGDVQLGSFTYDDATGSVGIGTTAPATPLELQFTDSEVYTENVGGNALRVRNLSQDTDTFSSLELMAGQTSAGGVHLARIFAIKESTSNTATSLAVNTRASDGVVSEKMRIDSNGNVGIGTSSPDAALEVVGAYNSMLKLTREDATYQYAEVHAGAGTVKLRGVDTSNTQHSRFVFETEKGSETLERFRIDTNGNVGIGTSGPGQKFEVKCDASQYNIFALSQHDTAGWGALHGGRMEYTMPGSGSASSRSFAIGKYRPTDTVHACTVLQLKSRDNGTAHLWMDDNNVLRFGTNSSNIGSTTGTSLGTAGTSDERAKNIESGFEYGLDHVMQLQPIAFAFKKDAEQTRTLGFGASASQQIIPESVFDTGNCVDGYDEHPEHEDMNQPKSDDTELGMDYMQLVPVLTKAIQELKAENDALKARVEALETPAE